MLKFNIDIEPEDVISNTYADLDADDNTYLSAEHYIQDIHFKDTVCIFHDINALFFIFVERNDLMVKIQNTRKVHSGIPTRHRKTLKKEFKAITMY